MAQGPPASPTTAVITVKAGGDRASQDVVSPLAGVTLQLYNGTTEPTTAVADAFATCTSDAEGDCSFIVPDVDTGGDNRDRRFWIVQTEAPAGWRINPTLRTGEAFGGASQATRYTFRTGEQLRAGETYTSGRQFMRGTGSDRDVSGGIWQSSRVNPALPNRCGLRVGLVIDLSASVGTTGGLDNLKNASQRFADSLVGTRSSVALFTFSSLAPATGANNANLPATSVSTQDGADTVKARIEGLTTGGHTNWDRGLFQAAPSPTTFDLVAILTDGNPSVYGNDVGPAGFSRIREVESGIFSANAIKREGTRVVAFGVGTGIDDLPNNLAAISGPVGDRDYYQTDTYEEAGAVLRGLALGDCDSTVTVIKQVVPDTAPPGSIEGAQPAGGWQFTADGGPVTSNPTTGVTAPTSGALNFDLRFPGGTGDSPVTFTETPQAGFTLQPVGGANAVCSNVISGADLPVTDVADGFTVTASRDDAITCTVYNRSPAPVASLTVDKTWNIDGDQFVDGTQPADFRAALTVTGQPDAVFGTELTNYLAGDEPTINETTDLSARPGCVLNSSRVIEANGATIDAALPYTPTLEAGANVYEVENVVTCRTELTLVKEVEGGDADPNAWLLSALEPPDSLAFASGTSGVTHPITPNVRYALAESCGDANYKQFVDPDADLVDGSTGSFRCIETEADRVTPLPGFATGLNGYVDARRGTYVQCAAINQTASLTLIKQVRNDNGGTATPADFDLTATPAADALVPQTVTGSDAGEQVSVRPGVSYELSESALDGYELESLVCSINEGDPEPATSLTLDPLDLAVCTFVNVDVPGTWAISKSSDPQSGSTVQPGSTITYTVTATKLEGIDPQDVVVSDDLSGVLKHATVVPGSVTPSVGTAAIDGDTLTWQIPVLGGEETVTYQVVVDQDAYGVTLANAVTSPGSSACPPEAARVRAAALDPGCPTTTEHFTPAWSLEKSSDPKSGSVVDPGSQITYTLTVTNTSDGTLEGATVTDDLSKVLAHASLVSVPDGATLTGDSLVWTVPTLTTRGETAALSYTVVVDLDATGVQLQNVATPGDGGTCGVCTTTHRTVPGGTPPGNVLPPGNVPPGTPPGIVPPGLLPSTGGRGWFRWVWVWCSSRVRV